MNVVGKIGLSLALISLDRGAYARPIELPPHRMLNLEAGDKIQLTGFIDFRGEIIFYTSKNARRLRLIYPYCISGVTSIPVAHIKRLLMHKVKIDAEVFMISKSVNDENNGIYTTNFVDGTPMKNWCWSDKALKITVINQAY